MTVPQVEMGGDFGVQAEQKNRDNERMKFRMDVQIKVMRVFGYFTDELEKIEDESKRTYAINDVFDKWIGDGKAVEFAKCFQDIVPFGTDRSMDEIDKVATLVAIEMGAELKH